jgi:hypothetical protein
VTSRERIGTWLFVASGLAALLAAWAAVTGGFRVHLGGIPISVRGEHRAALVAGLFAAAGLALHGGVRARVLAALRALWRRLTAIRVPPLPVAIALSVLMLGIGLQYGTKAAAGSDAYGYVSQVPLWLSGNLREYQPLAATVPWPNADWTFSPLGYAPAGDHTIVPVYAPGIPLLMALFVTIFGAGAEYWVTPLSGAALVLFTYLIGARLSRPAVGLASALMVAASPVVLMMTCWLLGDLPSAAFWMAALWLALSPTVPAAAGAGLAASAAIVVRPNLVPLAIVVPLVTLAAARGSARHAHARRLAAFGLAAAPGPLFIAWLFNDLFGSPFTSGYGGGLFSLGHIVPNLQRYVAWAWQSQGPFIFAFPLALVATGAGTRWWSRLALTAFAAAVVASYLAYIVFEEWWYLRFLLPAWPLAFVLAADGIWRLGHRWGTRAAAAALAVFTILASLHGIRFAADRHVLAVGGYEQRYADVGALVDRTLPPNAVIIAMQHNGSLRYHGRRTTIHYEFLATEWLDRAVAYLEGEGYPVYVVLDDGERAAFVERFAGTAALRCLRDPMPEGRPMRAHIHRLRAGGC